MQPAPAPRNDSFGPGPMQDPKGASLHPPNGAHFRPAQNGPAAMNSGGRPLGMMQSTQSLPTMSGGAAPASSMPGVGPDMGPSSMQQPRPMASFPAAAGGQPNRAPISNSFGPQVGAVGGPPVPHLPTAARPAAALSGGVAGGAGAQQAGAPLHSLPIRSAVQHANGVGGPPGAPAGPSGARLVSQPSSGFFGGPQSQSQPVADGHGGGALDSSRGNLSARSGGAPSHGPGLAAADSGPKAARALPSAGAPSQPGRPQLNPPLQQPQLHPQQQQQPRLAISGMPSPGAMAMPAVQASASAGARSGGAPPSIPSSSGPASHVGGAGPMGPPSGVATTVGHGGGVLPQQQQQQQQQQLLHPKQQQQQQRPGDQFPRGPPGGTAGTTFPVVPTAAAAGAALGPGDAARRALSVTSSSSMFPPSVVAAAPAPAPGLSHAIGGAPGAGAQALNTLQQQQPPAQPYSIQSNTQQMPHPAAPFPAVQGAVGAVPRPMTTPALPQLQQQPQQQVVRSLPASGSIISGSSALGGLAAPSTSQPHPAATAAAATGMMTSTLPPRGMAMTPPGPHQPVTQQHAAPAAPATTTGWQPPVLGQPMFPMPGRPLAQSGPLAQPGQPGHSPFGAPPATAAAAAAMSAGTPGNVAFPSSTAPAQHPQQHPFSTAAAADGGGGGPRPPMMMMQPMAGPRPNLPGGPPSMMMSPPQALLQQGSGGPPPMQHTLQQQSQPQPQPHQSGPPRGPLSMPMAAFTSTPPQPSHGGGGPPLQQQQTGPMQQIMQGGGGGPPLHMNRPGPPMQQQQGGGGGGPPLHPTGPPMMQPGGGPRYMGAQTAGRPPPMAGMMPQGSGTGGGGPPGGPPQSLAQPLSAREVPTLPAAPVTASSAAAAATASSQRIDPAAIPRPRYTSPLAPTRYPLSGEGFNVLPPAWADVVATDGNASGNCNPRFMRCSLGHVPLNKDILKETRIPLGVMLCPLAKPACATGEAGLSLVDFGDDGPVRCTRCRAYVSPFAKWGDGGASWTCALCGGVNETPGFYSAPVDQYGQRRDRYERPELLCGSVEFVAPPSYLMRPTTPFTVVFAVEASAYAVASGALSASLSAIRGVIDSLAGSPLGEGVRLGVLAFDSAVHFFDVSPGRSEPGVATAPDCEEAFCPLPPAQFTPRLAEARAHLVTLTDTLIPALFPPGAARTVASAGSAALRASFEALSDSGGRVVAFLSTLPSAGEGKLTPSRERGGVYGSDKERELYNAAPGGAGAWYAELAKSAVAKGVGVDVCVLGGGRHSGGTFMDCGTLASLTGMTGGDLRVYEGFVAPGGTTGAPTTTAKGRPPTMTPPPPTSMGGGGHIAAPAAAPVESTPSSSSAAAAVPPELLERLRAETISALCDRDIGSEAVVKLRVSAGLRVLKYLGNFAERAEGEADLASIDSEHALIAMLAHDGNEMKDGDEAFMQAAVLFTATNGQRRIRVHNARVIATSSIQVAFRHADMDTVLSILLRKGVTTALTKEVRFVHPDLTESAIDMLGAYRKHCAAGSSPGQLILPESLKLLPLYLSAVAKLAAFAPNKSPADKAAGGGGGGPKHGAGRGSAPAFGDVAVRADTRAVELCLLNALPASRLVPYLYPRLYVLHNMSGLHGTALDSDDDVAAATGPPDAMPTRPAVEPSSLSFDQLAYRVVLPPTTYPSIDQLAPHGLYLLESASGVYLWVGHDLDDEIVADLWGAGVGPASALPLCNSGIAGIGGINSVCDPPLPRLRTEWSLRVWTIIAAIRARRPPYLPLAVIVPGDAEGRETFAGLLVEDRVGTARSYVDLLCTMHASIQARMTQQA